MASSRKKSTSKTLVSSAFSRFGNKKLGLFLAIFAVVGVYLVFSTFAARRPIASLAATQMTLPAESSIVSDSQASGGRAVKMESRGTLGGSVTIPGGVAVNSAVVRARGDDCAVGAAMNVKVDNQLVISVRDIKSRRWANYSGSLKLSGGAHTVTITASSLRACNLFVDVINFYGSDPAPTPAQSATPTPTPQTPAPTATPTRTPVPSPTAVPSTTPKPTATPTPKPTSTPTPPPNAGTSKSVEVTYYGSYDNDPSGSLAIAHPVLHSGAGGTGTYADPLTFASPAGTGAYAWGTIIYVPIVQKYFIREDECATSWTAPNGCGAVSHVDLYVGNPSSSPAVVNCEDALTTDGNQTIIVNPPANLPVDSTPIWNQSTGKCMAPHV